MRYTMNRQEYTNIEVIDYAYGIRKYEVVRDMAKAWLIQFSGERGPVTKWFPKSECEIREDYFYIPKWLVGRKFRGTGVLSEKARDSLSGGSKKHGSLSTEFIMGYTGCSEEEPASLDPWSW